jgi:hypothetical protein
MKTTRMLLGLVILCGATFSIPAQTITTTPTNGPTTITIHARTTDGKLPVDVSCTVVQPQGQQLVFSMPQPLSLIGKSGDWTATNVPPGTYEVFLSPNYAEDIHSIVQFLGVKAGSNYSIDFVLSRGATFKGRVLDAATGEPIAKAIVYGETEARSYDLRTDAEGHYELPHITGTLRIEALTTNRVAQIVKLDAAAEDSTVSIPDIRLQHGGWISGRVERPAEVESNAFAKVSLEIQGSLPNNSVIYEAYAGADGTFRTGPLPSGTYTLHAEWRERVSKGGPSQNWQAKGSVSGVTVIVGQDTTNAFIPTKMIIAFHIYIGSIGGKLWG